jgi:hypothetical protein
MAGNEVTLVLRSPMAAGPETDFRLSIDPSARVADLKRQIEQTHPLGAPLAGMKLISAGRLWADTLTVREALGKVRQLLCARLHQPHYGA